MHFTVADNPTLDTCRDIASSCISKWLHFLKIFQIYRFPLNREHHTMCSYRTVLTWLYQHVQVFQMQKGVGVIYLLLWSSFYCNLLRFNKSLEWSGLFQFKLNHLYSHCHCVCDRSSFTIKTNLLDWSYELNYLIVESHFDFILRNFESLNAWVIS